MTMRISVIGLGKVGASLAAVLASKGHSVTGVDLDAQVVRAFNEGRAPTNEPGLQDIIDVCRKRLHATTDYEMAVAGSEASFIVVATPSEPDGTFSNAQVLAVVRKVGEALRGNPGYHLVCINSTVMPGSTGGPIRDTLERYSGRRVGEDLGLCYNPLFIALGTVIQGILRPDMVLLGHSDSKSGDVLAGLYRDLCDGQPTIKHMNFVNAELAKFAVNSFVPVKISFANMLADMCERLPGADVDVVTEAAGCDRRIGRACFKGALGYGGPCFPRDNIALGALARSLGTRADLASAADRVNGAQVARLVELVERHITPGGTLGVLGLSYKPWSPEIEESQALMLAQVMAERGFRIVAYDPMALSNACAALGGRIEAADDAADCVRRSDAVVVATPWPEFRQLPPEAMIRSDGRLTVIDCWRLLPAERFAHCADLVYLGQGPKLGPQGGSP